MPTKELSSVKFGPQFVGFPFAALFAFAAFGDFATDVLVCQLQVSLGEGTSSIVALAAPTPTSPTSPLRATGRLLLDIVVGCCLKSATDRGP